MKKLSNDSRNYFHKLTHILFLVEQTPVIEEKGRKQERKGVDITGT